LTAIFVFFRKKERRTADRRPPQNPVFYAFPSQENRRIFFLTSSLIASTFLLRMSR